MPTKSPGAPLPRIVILLGAGASRPLGIRTSAEFFDGGRIEEDLAPDRKKIFCALALKLGLRPEKVDLEDVISARLRAREAKQWGDGTHRGLPVDDLIALGHAVERLLYDDCKRIDPKACRDHYAPLFMNLSPGTHVSSLSVFTTNYDRAVEICLACRIPDGDPGLRSIDGRRIRLLDGFEESTSGGSVWSESAYDLPVGDYGQDCCVRLYKLHGSIDWVRKGREIHRVSPTARRLLTAEGDAEELLVYPGLKGLPDNPVSRYARARLERELYDADGVVVIGFSFRDDYIAEAFDKVRVWGKTPRGIIVDPASTEPRDSKRDQYRAAFAHMNTVRLPFDGAATAHGRRVQSAHWQNGSVQPNIVSDT